MVAVSPTKAKKLVSGIHQCSVVIKRTTGVSSTIAATCTGATAIRISASRCVVLGTQIRHGVSQTVMPGEVVFFFAKAYLPLRLQKYFYIV